ncbi:MAG TPA: hypothetical protein VN181_03940, partial [Thermoanaerobaculia bacterium]|nr:hypothetical protein [Thermoanaerobaculia bacterium]
VRIAVYQEDENGTFKKSDEKVITSYEGPNRCVAIQKSDWAGRALSMEFGDFGVPKKLERTNGAALVAATGSLAGALTSLQNSYAESLEKVVAIQKNQREVADNDLLSKIDKLKKQKDLLDAQLATEGATASHDLVLQQQLAAQQLATLQAQLDLQKAQQGSEDQLDIADLKNRIAVLEQQLLLLQAQKKLDDAKKP